MKILVTNDDGIDSPGLHNLAKALRKLGEVFTVAPASQQSAVGHALTIESPLRAHNYHLNGQKLGIAVNGTPSDCVKLAISSLLEHKPDMLVSGVNFGKNTSINIIYSGTVAAATEGMLLGIPAIAVSLDSYSYKTDTTTAAEKSVEIIERFLNNGFPPETLININVPNTPNPKGVRITRLSNSVWRDKYEKRTDPFGREYFWFSGEYIIKDKDLDSDDFALENDYISVTPVHFNFTNTKIIDKLKGIINFNF